MEDPQTLTDKANCLSSMNKPEAGVITDYFM